jgi:Holliday junction DNA helicase RuvB
MIPTPTIEEARAALDADIAAYGPWEQWIHPCSRCAKPRVFFGEDGAPLRSCPHCGYTPSLETLIGALAGRKKSRKDNPPPPASEAPPDDTPKAAPPMLDDVIGNPAAVMQLRTVLDAFAYAKAAAEKGKKLAFPHLLLSGPGGTGKTMLAEIVAREIGRPIHLQLGQTLGNPAKVAAVLLSLKPGAVLFIDEIHGLKVPCQEALYRATEDGVLVPVTGPGKPAGRPVRLPPFTLIGATTDEWGLLPSMCQRFDYKIRLSRMTPAELAEALSQRAVRKGLLFDPAAVAMIAERSLGTPRLAVKLLAGCLATAQAQGGAEITVDVVKMTCAIWGIDGLGLDRTARQYLQFLADAGGMLRLNVLASKLDGLAKTTVERKIEPDLVWLGLVEKEPNGRRLTAAGREHLNREGK